MLIRWGTTTFFCISAGIFVLEWATGAVGNDARLLALGALPDSGQLHHEYWRLITFGFLHSNLTHFLLNGVLLLMVGPIVERRASTAWLFITFLCASVASGAGILVKHQLWPSRGVSVGASGGLFGLLGAALVLVYRRPTEKQPIRIGLVIVLAAGLTYSVFPGISMVGHVMGLIVGAGIGLAIAIRQRQSSLPRANSTPNPGT